MNQKKDHFSRFFIAILPPETIQREITDFKEEIARDFKSSHALKSPPHITLLMPFRWKTAKSEQLITTVNELNLQVAPFEIKLRDFDFFDPRVVFVAVEKTEELVSLQKRVITTCRYNLKIDLGNYRDLPFHPHVTIGFRDLKKEEFFKAKEVFRKRQYEARFTCERMSLLKHDGEQWEPFYP
ncbi:MAG: 2'-5' RNA ligase family protein [Bacteroidota bacterium]